MKLFSTILSRKRGVILFVAAFMLPLIFVVVVGIDTFSKRQQTTHNLLESNLWLSGRSALNQLEAHFIELESKALDSEYIKQLLKDDSLKRTVAIPGIFIINHDYRILHPYSAEEKNNTHLGQKKDWSSNFKKYINRAEAAELASRQFLKAEKDYKTSLQFAKTPQQKALAINGIARSQAAGKKYKEAILNYQLLKNKYSQTRNLGGHPYGITAPLQLYALNKSMGENFFTGDSLYLTYQLIRDKCWIINSSSYFFFKTEYESILDNNTDTTVSRFEKELNFNTFTKDFIVPAIKERLDFSTFKNEVETKRFCIGKPGNKQLVSFKKIHIQNSEQFYFAGILWNPDTLIKHVIQAKLSILSKETGLEFKLVDETNNYIFDSRTDLPEEGALVLSFNQIPFPFSLHALQPGYKKLETNTKLQALIYILLLVIVTGLMIFAVFVLLRDIGRETDTMLLRTEFVHNVSHELKTPLSLIRLYGETLLLKQALPEADRKEGLQIITKESERLSHMINNILDFSKIEMGRKEFDLKPGNIKEVLINTLDSYRYHFIKKGFSITENIESNIPEVLFDQNAVEGILINLFSNAIKFSNNSKTLIVRLVYKNAILCLEVEDRGVGIPSKEIANIFERFYRVKNADDFEARGSGLGLTLVKHAVDAHGWKIEVKSKYGLGSCFTITIPVKQEKEE